MLELLMSSYCYGGYQQRYRHYSTQLKCLMNFSVFLPAQAVTHLLETSKQKSSSACLVLLAGRGGDDLSFSEKSGVQKWAAELGMVLLMPDTSPRGEHIADMPEEKLGQGASYYFNALVEPWKTHYQMESYICEELLTLLSQLQLNVSYFGLCGHSMGGHGALMLGLRHPEIFSSLSAIAPVCQLDSSERGRAILSNYLGSDASSWQFYQAASLLEVQGWSQEILVDIGAHDEYKDYLALDKLQDAVSKRTDSSLDLHIHAHYDHSYYFIKSVMEKHLRFHFKQFREKQAKQ